MRTATRVILCVTLLVGFAQWSRADEDEQAKAAIAIELAKLKLKQSKAVPIAPVPQPQRLTTDNGSVIELQPDGTWAYVNEQKTVAPVVATQRPFQEDTIQATPALPAVDRSITFPAGTGTGRTITPVLRAGQRGVTNCTSGG